MITAYKNFFVRKFILASMKKYKIFIFYWIVFFIAFDACVNYYKENYPIKNKDFVFSHGGKYKLPDEKILIGSYHPSPRNVNTGRINIKKMVLLLNEIKKIMKPKNGN